MMRVKTELQESSSSTTSSSSFVSPSPIAPLLTPLCCSSEIDSGESASDGNDSMTSSSSSLQKGFIEGPVQRRCCSPSYDTEERKEKEDATSSSSSSSSSLFFPTSSSSDSQNYVHSKTQQAVCTPESSFLTSSTATTTCTTTSSTFLSTSGSPTSPSPSPCSLSLPSSEKRKKMAAGYHDAPEIRNELLPPLVAFERNETEEGQEERALTLSNVMEEARRNMTNLHYLHGKERGTPPPPATTTTTAPTPTAARSSFHNSSLIINHDDDALESVRLPSQKNDKAEVSSLQSLPFQQRQPTTNPSYNPHKARHQQHRTTTTYPSHSHKTTHTQKPHSGCGSLTELNTSKSSEKMKNKKQKKQDENEDEKRYEPKAFPVDRAVGNKQSGDSPPYHLHDQNRKGKEGMENSADEYLATTTTTGGSCTGSENKNEKGIHEDTGDDPHNQKENNITQTDETSDDSLNTTGKKSRMIGDETLPNSPLMRSPEDVSLATISTALQINPSAVYTAWTDLQVAALCEFLAQQPIPSDLSRGDHKKNSSCTSSKAWGSSDRERFSPQQKKDRRGEGGEEEEERKDVSHKKKKNQIDQEENEEAREREVQLEDEERHREKMDARKILAREQERKEEEKREKERTTTKGRRTEDDRDEEKEDKNDSGDHGEDRGTLHLGWRSTKTEKEEEEDQEDGDEENGDEKKRRKKTSRGRRRRRSHSSTARDTHENPSGRSKKANTTTTLMKNPATKGNSFNSIEEREDEWREEEEDCEIVAKNQEEEEEERRRGGDHAAIKNEWIDSSTDHDDTHTEEKDRQRHRLREERFQKKGRKRRKKLAEEDEEKEREEGEQQEEEREEDEERNSLRSRSDHLPEVVASHTDTTRQDRENFTGLADPSSSSLPSPRALHSSSETGETSNRERLPKKNDRETQPSPNQKGDSCCKALFCSASSSLPSDSILTSLQLPQERDKNAAREREEEEDGMCILIDVDTPQEEVNDTSLMKISRGRKRKEDHPEKRSDLSSLPMDGREKEETHHTAHASHMKINRENSYEKEMGSSNHLFPRDISKRQPMIEAVKDPSSSNSSDRNSSRRSLTLLRGTSHAKATSHCEDFHKTLQQHLHSQHKAQGEEKCQDGRSTLDRMRKSHRRTSFSSSCSLARAKKSQENSLSCISRGDQSEKKTKKKNTDKKRRKEEENEATFWIRVHTPEERGCCMMQHDQLQKHLIERGRRSNDLLLVSRSSSQDLQRSSPSPPVLLHFNSIAFSNSDNEADGGGVYENPTKKKKTKISPSQHLPTLQEELDGNGTDSDLSHTDHQESNDVRRKEQDEEDQKEKEIEGEEIAIIGKEEGSREGQIRGSPLNGEGSSKIPASSSTTTRSIEEKEEEEERKASSSSSLSFSFSSHPYQDGNKHVSSSSSTSTSSSSFSKEASETHTPPPSTATAAPAALQLTSMEAHSPSPSPSSSSSSFSFSSSSSSENRHSSHPLGHEIVNESGIFPFIKAERGHQELFSPTATPPSSITTTSSSSSLSDLHKNLTVERRERPSEGVSYITHPLGEKPHEERDRRIDEKKRGRRRRGRPTAEGIGTSSTGEKNAGGEGGIEKGRKTQEKLMEKKDKKLVIKEKEKDDEDKEEEENEDDILIVLLPSANEPSHTPPPSLLGMNDQRRKIEHPAISQSEGPPREEELEGNTRDINVKQISGEGEEEEDEGMKAKPVGGDDRPTMRPSDNTLKKNSKPKECSSLLLLSSSSSSSISHACGSIDSSSPRPAALMQDENQTSSSSPVRSHEEASTVSSFSRKEKEGHFPLHPSDHSHHPVPLLSSSSSSFSSSSSSSSVISSSSSVATSSPFQTQETPESSTPLPPSPFPPSLAGGPYNSIQEERSANVLKECVSSSSSSVTNSTHRPVARQDTAAVAGEGGEVTFSSSSSVSLSSKVSSVQAAQEKNDEKESSRGTNTSPSQLKIDKRRATTFLRKSESDGTRGTGSNHGEHATEDEEEEEERRLDHEKGDRKNLEPNKRSFPLRGGRTRRKRDGRRRKRVNYDIQRPVRSSLRFRKVRSDPRENEEEEDDEDEVVIIEEEEGRRRRIGEGETRKDIDIETDKVRKDGRNTRVVQVRGKRGRRRGRRGSVESREEKEKGRKEEDKDEDNGDGIGLEKEEEEEESKDKEGEEEAKMNERHTQDETRRGIVRIIPSNEMTDHLDQTREEKDLRLREEELKKNPGEKASIEEEQTSSFSSSSRIEEKNIERKKGRGKEEEEEEEEPITQETVDTEKGYTSSKHRHMPSEGIEMDSHKKSLHNEREEEENKTKKNRQKIKGRIVALLVNEEGKPPLGDVPSEEKEETRKETAMETKKMMHDLAMRQTRSKETNTEERNTEKSKRWSAQPRESFERIRRRIEEEEVEDEDERKEKKLEEMGSLFSELRREEEENKTSLLSENPIHTQPNVSREDEDDEGGEKIGPSHTGERGGDPDEAEHCERDGVYTEEEEEMKKSDMEGREMRALLDDLYEIKRVIEGHLRDQELASLETAEEEEQRRRRRRTRMEKGGEDEEKSRREEEEENEGQTTVWEGESRKEKKRGKEPEAPTLLLLERSVSQCLRDITLGHIVEEREKEREEERESLSLREDGEGKLSRGEDKGRKTKEKETKQDERNRRHEEEEEAKKRVTCEESSAGSMRERSAGDPGGPANGLNVEGERERKEREEQESVGVDERQKEKEGNTKQQEERKDRQTEEKEREEEEDRDKVSIHPRAISRENESSSSSSQASREEKAELQALRAIEKSLSYAVAMVDAPPHTTVETRDQDLSSSLVEEEEEKKKKKEGEKRSCRVRDVFVSISSGIASLHGLSGDQKHRERHQSNLLPRSHPSCSPSSSSLPSSSSSSSLSSSSSSSLPSSSTFLSSSSSSSSLSSSSSSSLSSSSSSSLSSSSSSSLSSSSSSSLSSSSHPPQHAYRSPSLCFSPGSLLSAIPEIHLCKAEQEKEGDSADFSSTRSVSHLSSLLSSPSLPPQSLFRGELQQRIESDGGSEKFIEGHPRTNLSSSALYDTRLRQVSPPPPLSSYIQPSSSSSLSSLATLLPSSSSSLSSSSTLQHSERKIRGSCDRFLAEREREGERQKDKEEEKRCRGGEGVLEAEDPLYFHYHLPPSSTHTSAYRKREEVIEFPQLEEGLPSPACGDQRPAVLRAPPPPLPRIDDVLSNHRKKPAFPLQHKEKEEEEEEEEEEMTRRMRGVKKKSTSRERGDTATSQKERVERLELSFQHFRERQELVRRLDELVNRQEEEVQMLIEKHREEKRKLEKEERLLILKHKEQLRRLNETHLQQSLFQAQSQIIHQNKSPP